VHRTVQKFKTHNRESLDKVQNVEMATHLSDHKI